MNTVGNDTYEMITRPGTTMLPCEAYGVSRALSSDVFWFICTYQATFSLIVNYSKIGVYTGNLDEAIPPHVLLIHHNSGPNMNV